MATSKEEAIAIARRFRPDLDSGKVVVVDDADYGDRRLPARYWRVTRDGRGGWNAARFKFY